MRSQHFSGSFGRNFVDSAIGIIFEKILNKWVLIGLRGCKFGGKSYLLTKATNIGPPRPMMIQL